MAKLNPPNNRQRHRLRRLSLLTFLKKLWQNSLKFARKSPRLISLLVLTLSLILFIVTVTLLPSEQPFEGRLELNNLSFISNIDQPFLNNINTIKQISVENSLPLTLTGTFNDLTLQNINQITLKPLTNSNPSWQIESSSNLNLEIQELQLTQDSQINNLHYDSYNKRLSLEIIPKSPLTLTINPSDTLTLRFNNYQIPQLPNTKSITWQPDNQLILEIKQPIKLSFQFPEIPNSAIFREQLSVKEVKFNELIVNSSDFSQNYQKSSIVGGIIRLANQNHDLADGQFLTFYPADSIRNLFHLKLTSEKSSTLKTNDNQTLSINESFEGLNVDISGKSKQIKIGINPNLPIATFQASLLEKWLPRDAVIGLIAFLSSLVATLIGWIWELLTDEN